MSYCTTSSWSQSWLRLIFQRINQHYENDSSQINEYEKNEIEELWLTGFPPIQSQRWNSIYLTLKYIIKNLGGIIQILETNDSALMVMNSLLELKEDLEPAYEFTTICEIENANQADIYFHYRSLKVKLQAILTTRAS